MATEKKTSLQKLAEMNTEVTAVEAERDSFLTIASKLGEKDERAKNICLATVKRYETSLKDLYASRAYQLKAVCEDSPVAFNRALSAILSTENDAAKAVS